MIFRAAWSCFLVRKEPLAEEKMKRPYTTLRHPLPSAPYRPLAGKDRGQDNELGLGGPWTWTQWAGIEGWRAGAILVAGRQAARGPAAIGAVVLLDEHSRSSALLKSLLFIVASELALDQDGRLGHLLIECKLQGWGGGTGAEMEEE